MNSKESMLGVALLLIAGSAVALIMVLLWL
jgi:hypothetical protein